MKVGSAEQASLVLRSGAVALVPTETVAGLVSGESGLRRIFEIKARDPEKPVALLCASGEQAFGLAQTIPPLAEKLARLYWPGPLTLVLDRRGGGTIGLRVPDHPTIQRLLAAYGGPLYATSANLSGEPAPISLEDVDPVIRDSVDIIVEGAPGAGESSAVVDLSGGRIRLLRSTTDLTEQTLARLAEQIT